jgi:16S rRNA (cytosine967-C5)-methyltransferase
MAAAAVALERMEGGARLPDALDQVLGQWALPADSYAPVRDMAYASVRRLGTARAILTQLAQRPIAAPLAAILHTALVQLLDPVRPAAIIVDQAVAAVRGTARNPRQAASEGGFANAILRRFLRERETCLTALQQTSAAQQTDADWPTWWVAELRKDHPEQWPEVLAVGAQTPPLTLRVDCSRTTPDDYLSLLAAQGIAAVQVGRQAIRFERGCPVSMIPGFDQGLVSVQDAGAQLAAPLLGVESGHRVLDACAAPGGKTVHLLELFEAERTVAELVALDVDEQRLQRVRENVERSGFSVMGGAMSRTSQTVRKSRTTTTVQLLTANAMNPESWWDGRAFDRILLDAPCTASGIVRRHPEIRWLRRRGDLATLAATQRGLLDALWPLLAPGGRLLYVTCSLFRTENEAVIGAFIDSTAGCRRLALEWSFRSPDASESVAQLLPIANPTRDHDGFFYALLERDFASPGVQKTLCAPVLDRTFAGAGAGGLGFD